MGRPLVGKLGGGLCEVRTTFDKNEYRVFFYIEREQVVVVHSTMVLVHGIRKKTQKTPGGGPRARSASDEGGHMTIGPPRDELEELFDELGELHGLRAGVQKKVLAHDIKQAMKAKGSTAIRDGKADADEPRGGVPPAHSDPHWRDARFAPARGIGARSHSQYQLRTAG